MWNTTYQIFVEGKAIIKQDACMKFSDETKLLYMGRDESGVGMGTALLQTRDNMSCNRDEVPDNGILRPTAYASKSLIGQRIYSNIEKSTGHTV